MGLYRASANVIMHNRINFDVRGYSHGFYFRGQDSAGLLIYEQSCRNIVAFNSVTHGGDGLFLWAGQSTMDDGQGGANDNLFYGNDFSFAPTNGMEATFSRNAFINNRVEGNWHGLWGGYSFQSVVMGNRFSRNIEAIAIEHGQENRIVGNHFTDDTTAIHLWWNRVEPSDWGYPKFRDTRSRDYTILGNSFSGERVALRVENSQRVRGDGNRFRDVDTVARLAGDTSGWAMSAPVEELADVPVPREFVVRPLPGGMNAMTPEARRFGRERIIVDAWGPYDWQSPRLWPAGRSDARPMRLRVLGPPGRWRMIAHNGVASWSADSGRVGDTLVVVPASGREDDYRVELEYRGARVTTPFGETLPAGAPVRFEWSRFEPANRWQVRFIAWDSSAAPLDSTARLARAFNGPPVATLDTNRLDLTWYAPPRKSIPQSLLLTVAVDTVTLAPGSYRLRTIADDAVRVYLDGRLLLDDWVPGDSHVKEVPFTATGRHELRVEHVQVGGWYELRVDILRDTRDSSP